MAFSALNRGQIGLPSILLDVAFLDRYFRHADDWLILQSRVHFVVQA